jgi:transcriptional regulator with XRE-family HTH domain
MTPIREARERQGLSARELAYFANCSAMTVSRLERGVSENVAPAVKARIARALRVPVEELWPRHEQSTAKGADVV